MRYLSPDADAVNLENVLLYNVGQGSVGHLMGRGVICRRLRSPDRLHHVSYDLTPGPQADLALNEVVGHVDVSWDGPPPRTAGQWWCRLRAHAQVRPAPLDRFALRVVIGGPDLTGTRLAGLMKSLLDGLVACFHAHDGGHRAELQPLLAELPDATWPLLCDRSSAVLGTRAVVRPYRRGLAWNPADDHCDAFQVQLTPARTWSLRAALGPSPHTG